MVKPDTDQERETGKRFPVWSFTIPQGEHVMLPWAPREKHGRGRRLAALLWCPQKAGWAGLGFAQCRWAPGFRAREDRSVQGPHGRWLGVWTWAAGERDWLTSNISLELSPDVIWKLSQAIRWTSCPSAMGACALHKISSGALAVWPCIMPPDPKETGVFGGPSPFHICF